MDYFVRRKVNPNLAFSQIEIGCNISYSCVTCFQLTYLLWNNPRFMWNDSQEGNFQRIFEAILSDHRTDLTLRFSESNLVLHRGVLEQGTREIKQLHGHSLEGMTIAHYAAILNDYTMLSRFLDLEPRLIHMMCCMTKGKASLSENHRIGYGGRKIVSGTIGHEWGVITHSRGRTVEINLSLETDKQLSSILPSYVQAVRVTNVTLLHLAAKIGGEGVLACLGSRHPNPSVVDSDNKTPQAYLQLSLMEGLVENSRALRAMFQSLGLVTRYSPALPEVNKLIHNEGYDLLYDTSRKIAVFAHQRLGKDSFGAATRTNHRWVENLIIPELNRATDNDFKYSGWNRGHLVPAEDATGSDKRMGDTFKFENAVPQNENLNKGAWSRLESHVRGLVHQNDLVQVFTGPLFLPKATPQGDVIEHGLIGGGGVHVPTHLFKVIYKHNRETTLEIYILPNQTIPPGKRFSAYQYNGDMIDFIQRCSGILFNEWIRR
jgi:endonuclease G